jgi:hypothetical protein
VDRGSDVAASTAVAWKRRAAPFVVSLLVPLLSHTAGAISAPAQNLVASRDSLRFPSLPVTPAPRARAADSTRVDSGRVAQVLPAGDAGAFAPPAALLLGDAFAARAVFEGGPWDGDPTRTGRPAVLAAPGLPPTATNVTLGELALSDPLAGVVDVGGLAGWPLDAVAVGWPRATDPPGDGTVARSRLALLPRAPARSELGLSRGTEDTRIVRAGVAGMLSATLGVTAAVQSLDRDALTDGGDRTHDATIMSHAALERVGGGAAQGDLVVHLLHHTLAGRSTTEPPFLSADLKRAPAWASLGWTRPVGSGRRTLRAQLVGFRDRLALDGVEQDAFGGSAAWREEADATALGASVRYPDGNDVAAENKTGLAPLSHVHVLWERATYRSILADVPIADTTLARTSMAARFALRHTTATGLTVSAGLDVLLPDASNAYVAPIVDASTSLGKRWRLVGTSQRWIGQPGLVEGVRRIADLSRSTPRPSVEDGTTWRVAVEPTGAALGLAAGVFIVRSANRAVPDSSQLADGLPARVASVAVHLTGLDVGWRFESDRLHARARGYVLSGDEAAQRNAGTPRAAGSGSVEWTIPWLGTRIVASAFAEATTRRLAVLAANEVPASVDLGGALAVRLQSAWVSVRASNLLAQQIGARSGPAFSSPEVVAGVLLRLTN